MKIVTIETAQRLKAAGFQQPEYSSLEKWYADGAIEYGGKIELYFAPDAIDILKELGEDYCLHVNGDGWSVSIYERDLYSEVYDSPSEACAEKWIECNAKAQPK
jgi:hypothetical protein